MLHEAAMLAHDALDLSQWWIRVAIDINGDPLKQLGGINCLSVFGGQVRGHVWCSSGNRGRTHVLQGTGWQVVVLCGHDTP